jgi:hypothetical protein
VDGGVGVKDTMIPAGYKFFPDVAMTRFDQEKGERLNEKKIIIPQDEDSTLPVRQAVSAPTTTRQDPVPKTITIHPSGELAARKAKEEEIVRKELNRIQAAQESPTSLAGAIRALHMVNAHVKKLAVVSRLPQGVQQRLGSKRVSSTSVELEEVEKIPERGGERGNTSRTTARASSPTTVKHLSILTDSKEESDSAEMEKTRRQKE